MRQYLQIIFTSSKNQADILSDLLEAGGAVSVSLNDAVNLPIYEPLPGEMPLWDQVFVTALFLEEAEMQAALEMVGACLVPLPPYKIETLEDRDWVTETQAEFPPQWFGGKLWIYPEWQTVPPEHTPVLRLAPGLGFGTGTHPTTKLCLEALTKFVGPGMTVLDVGCGSGILGLAALTLSAEKVYAVDIDPQALEATFSNAKRNNLASKDQLFIGLPKDLPAVQVDLLVANILAAPLMELKSWFQTLLKPGGILILSGLLSSQAEAVMQHYADWRTLTVFLVEDEWACLVSRP